MLSEPSFVSCAQNGEDVVLWRALRRVPEGRYVDVGANHPLDDSVTRAFYDRGWSGITVEPVPHFAALQRLQRPRDQVVEAAVTTTSEQITLHVVPGTGLSTTVDSVSDRHADAGITHVDTVVTSVRLDDVLAEHGWSPDEDIHFMVIDVEGAEQDVLDTLDLHRWRPWVLVVESTTPNTTMSTHESWEPQVLAAGYQFRLFDGLSRFYVTDERAEELGGLLSYPACVLDNYVPLRLSTAEHELQELRDQVAHWRTIALTQWADALAGALARSGRGSQPEAEHLHRELEAMRQTLSWRITRPLRAVRGLLAGAPTR